MDNNNYEVTLSEYWRIIRKRKWTLILVFSTVMISTFIFTKLQTPVYESSLELKIEKRQNLITITSEKVDSGPGSSTLATELLLIKSLPIMEKVVERMEVLPADPQKRKNAIHVLSFQYQNNVEIEQIRNTNIIRLRAASNDPQKAALIASAIADVYIVENVEGRKKQSKALIEYIDRQLKQYKEALTQEESLLQKFKQNEKVFEVTPEVKKNLDRMTVEGTFEFEAKMLTIENELTKLKFFIKESKEEILADAFKDGLLSGNYIFVGLKRRLLELEFNRFLLLIDYTEKHPDLIKKDQVIADVKNKIFGMLKSFSHKPFTLDV